MCGIAGDESATVFTAVMQHVGEAKLKHVSQLQNRSYLRHLCPQSRPTTANVTPQTIGANGYTPQTTRSTMPLRHQTESFARG